MESIRVATEQDAAAIAHVHVESWRSTYAGIVPDDYLASLNVADRVPQWQEWLGRGILVYVAELDEEVVGFASGGPIREPLPNCDAELYAIYLLAHAQHRGLGTALLHKVAATLRIQRFQAMAVWVLERNPAKSFYEKAGARLIARKDIEIGGVLLQGVALVWPDLQELSHRRG